MIIVESKVTQVFEAQKNLMQLYVNSGKLPEFPLSDLSDRNTQQVLRKYIDYTVEELIETFDKAEEIYHQYKTSPRSNPKENILAFNEEISDVNHFMLELMIFLNIDAEDLQGYYQNLFEEELQIKYPLDRLNFSFFFQAAKRHQERFFREDLREIRALSITLISDEYIVVPGLMAGRITGPAHIRAQEKVLFQVIKYLNRMKSLLKLKEWREDHENKINPLHIQKELMEAWLHWMVYMNLVGVTPNTLTHNYLEKNRINIERLKNGY